MPINEVVVNGVITNFKAKSGNNNVNKNVFQFSMETCSAEIVDISGVKLRGGWGPPQTKKN